MRGNAVYIPVTNEKFITRTKGCQDKEKLDKKGICH